MNLLDILRENMERAGILKTLEERCLDVINSVDMRVMDCARAMGVKVFGHNGERIPIELCWGVNGLASAWYAVPFDMVAVNVPAIAHNGTCVNLTIAHELIHATGHFRRLDRDRVGSMSKHEYEMTNFGPKPVKPFNLPTREEVEREEVIAQYGALILIRYLGIDSPNAESETRNYLKTYGRPKGPTESEMSEAAQAAEYVLAKLAECKTKKTA